MKYNILVTALICAMSICVFDVTAQDSLAVVKADTTQLDSVASHRPVQVRPTRTLGQVSVIDTLATESAAICIVQFNDNTWRYVWSEDYKNDP